MGFSYWLNAISLVDLLALVCDVYCDLVTFPFDILGIVWYLIVWTSDPYCLSYLG